MNESLSWSLLCLIVIAVFTILIFLQGEFGPLFN